MAEGVKKSGGRAPEPAAPNGEREASGSLVQQLVARYGYASLGRRLQRRRAERRQGSDPEAANGDKLHATAAAGVRGNGGALPHQEQIQKSFGRHDVSGIVAHQGPEAKQAAETIGAEAYASGHQVAFADSSPTLHTAAHEAAHVIQQRGGVQLAGGAGQEGDPHEKHADEVADLVTQGKSAEPLLDQVSGNAAPGEAVQRKIRYHANDSMQSLGEAHKDQLDEIAQWDASPYEVTYEEAEKKLKWKLSEGSASAIEAKISQMFQADAETLAGSDSVASQVWSTVQGSWQKWKYQAEAVQNFRSMLLLKNNAAALTELFSNLHGEVREQQIKAVQQALKQSLGRPILEDDQESAFVKQPSQAKEWAEYGWAMITNNWAGIEPTKRPEFVDKAFNHNKGYNRARNHMSTFLSPESGSGKLQAQAKEKGWKKLKGDPVALMAAVMAFYMMQGMNDPKVSAWRQFLADKAEEIGDAFDDESLDIDFDAAKVKEFAKGKNVYKAVYDSGFEDDAIDDEQKK